MNQATLEVSEVSACSLVAGEAQAGSSADSSAFFQCYREKERKSVISSLLAGSSLLVVGLAGCGKSTLARFVVAALRSAGEPVAIASPASAKQWLTEIALQLGVIEPREKIPSTAQLQILLADHLQRSPAVLVCDDAHRLQLSIRCWLEDLLARGQRMLLVATTPPARDIFLKLPRIELPPLDHKSIRGCMEAAAREFGLDLTPAQFSALSERCGGNPMLARRVVKEHAMGLEPDSLDHTQWIDGTPLLLAALLCFSVLRFIGRGLHSTDLYLMGGIMTVAIGVFRLLLWSLPRKSNKLGA